MLCNPQSEHFKLRGSPVGVAYLLTRLLSYHHSTAAMIQKDTLAEHIRTLFRTVAEICDRYALEDLTDLTRMRPVLLAALPNQPVTTGQWQSDEPPSILIPTAVIFNSCVERATVDVSNTTLGLQGEINMTSSIKIELTGYVYGPLQKHLGRRMPWNAMVALLEGRTIWEDPDAKLGVPRMIAKGLLEDGSRRAHEAFELFKITSAKLPQTEVCSPYFLYVLLSLIAVQEEFFSSRYLLRPTICRNVLDIVELVGFDLDHPFGTAPFALFDNLYFLRKRGRSMQCRCGALKQLEQEQERDVDPESVVDLRRAWCTMGEERDDYEGQFFRILGIVENLLLHVGTC